MKLTLYSIYDETVQSFGYPMAFHNDGEAMREIESVFDQENTMSRSPQYFKLYRLSEFDTEDGTITQTAMPILIVTLSELLRRKREMIRRIKAYDDEIEERIKEEEENDRAAKNL